MNGRRLLVLTLGIASSLAVAGPVASAEGDPPGSLAPVVKPAPAPPPDAWNPDAGPAIVAKPNGDKGSNGAPLTAWTASITASPDRLWPREYSTVTATTNQELGPTPYYLSIYQSGWEEDGVWRDRLVKACGTGTSCSVSVVQNTVTQRYYRTFVASYSASYPPPDAQVQAPPYGWPGREVSWHSTGIGLAASANTVSVGGATTITATTGDDVGPSPFYIQIFDETTQTRVAVCGFGQSCSAVVSQAVATTHRFASFVSDHSTAFPPTGTISASAPTYVTWADAGFQVALSAPGTVVNTYQVTVTATVNRDIGPTPYFIRIFNIGTGQLVGTCGFGTTCSVIAPINRGWNSHVAFLSTSADAAMPPAAGVASSNSVHTENIYIG